MTTETKEYFDKNFNLILQQLYELNQKFENLSQENARLLQENRVLKATMAQNMPLQNNEPIADSITEELRKL